MQNETLYALGHHCREKIEMLIRTIQHTDIGSDCATQERILKRILRSRLQQACEIAVECQSLGRSGNIHNTWVNQMISEAREAELAHLKKLPR